MCGTSEPTDIGDFYLCLSLRLSLSLSMMSCIVRSFPIIFIHNPIALESSFIPGVYVLFFFTRLFFGLISLFVISSLIFNSFIIYNVIFQSFILLFYVDLFVEIKRLDRQRLVL